MPLVEPVPYTVRISEALGALNLLGGDWEAFDDAKHLIVDQLTVGLAPTMSEARISWQFGEMSRLDPAGVDVEAMEYRAPADLVGKYVWIHVPDLIGPGEDLDWVGYIRDDPVINWAEEEYDNAGTPTQRISGGEQQFVAVGLEYFLAREQVMGSSSRFGDRNKRPHTYNAGCGDGRDPDVTKRGNKQPATDPVTAPYVPLAFSFDEDAEEWTAAAAVKHLLAEHCPRNQVDAAAPLEWLLDEDAIKYLDWYKPTVPELEGRTLWDILDDLIDRRRGLVWWLETRNEPTFEVELQAVIHVTSIATAPVALPNAATLPAADSIVTIANPNSLDLLEPVIIGRDGTRTYHSVRVRGARRTTTHSAAGPSAIGGVGGYEADIPINSTIGAIYQLDEKTAYNLGVRPTLDAPNQAIYDALTDPKKADWNDRYRQLDKFERVYRHFSVNVVSSASENLSPIIQQDTGSITGQITMPLTRPVRVLRSTRLLAGYSYADATAPTHLADAEDRGREFVQAFVCVFLPNACDFWPITMGEVVDGGETAAGSTDGGWRYGNKLSYTQERGFIVGAIGDGEPLEDRRFTINVSMAPLAAEPGILLATSGGMPHSLLNPADPAEFAISRYPKTLSWRSTLVTVTTEWDAFCEAVWPITTATASPVQELLIKIGERARFDWLAKGTVYDIDEHGHIKQVETPGALRDDRKLCETIAILAYQWYGQERATVQLKFRKTCQPVSIGDLITTIGTDDAEQTVNAIVSQITHHLEEGGTDVKCLFPELDFQSFA